MDRLKILWLNHFVPYPPKGGCFQRTFNLLTRLAAEHEVHLLAMRPKAATHPEAETREAKRELERHCASVEIIDIAAATQPARLALRGVASLAGGRPLTVTIFESPAMDAAVRRVLRDRAIDLVHFDTISLALYLPLVGDRPTTMTHHVAESFMIHRRIAREPNPIRKAFFYGEWLALERYERRFCSQFGANLVMSSLDREILQTIAPDARFVVVPNGVDVDFFRPATPPADSGRALIFAGRLDQYSNRDAILYFTRDVWPRVGAAHPDVTMHIIGSNPPAELTGMATADPRLQVHGFVPDVRPFFQQSTVAVCPIRDGGGTRIKVLDALAQGMPLVATTVGCEGIDVVPDRDLLIADTAEAFAAQIGRLLVDGQLRERLSANARRLAEDVYSWDGIARRLSDLCRELVANHARSPVRTNAVSATGAGTA
jgi:glycosyltransferase involved in cell wall biosynthesis